MLPRIETSPEKAKEGLGKPPIVSPLKGEWLMGVDAVDGVCGWSPSLEPFERKRQYGPSSSPH